MPLIFDFRDEWDLSSRYLEQVPRGWWSQFVQGRMQRSLLKQADAVIATTQASATAYQTKLSEVGNSAKSQCIYNGFDPADFPTAETPAASRSASETFRLVYAGTLWNLTDIEPLVQAVEHIHARKPEMLARLELVCVGRKTPEQQRILERVRATRCRAELRDYCRHEDVAGWLRGADALCLTLADVPGAERVVPAKLFEYLATRKSILSIVPHGETSRIVRRFRPEGHFVPRDVFGIANWLMDRLSGGGYAAASRHATEALEEYSRPYLTGRLAALLDSLSGGLDAAPVHSAESEAVTHPQGERCLAGA